MIAKWWLRFKHKFAHGTEKHWTWQPLGAEKPTKDELEGSTFDGICSEYIYSDKYRGIDYDVLPLSEVPDEVIEVIVKRHLEACTYHRTKGSEYAQELERRALVKNPVSTG